MGLFTYGGPGGQTYWQDPRTGGIDMTRALTPAEIAEYQAVVYNPNNAAAAVMAGMGTELEQAAHTQSIAAKAATDINNDMRLYELNTAIGSPTIPSVIPPPPAGLQALIQAGLSKNAPDPVPTLAPEPVLALSAEPSPPPPVPEVTTTTVTTTQTAAPVVSTSGVQTWMWWAAAAAVALLIWWKR